jgi:hypothetical protein
VSQWYLMSMALDLFCLIFSFKIPNAVELSIINGVDGCVCPNSVRVTLIGAPLWAFWKQAPTSDYAADSTTFFMTEAAFSNDPLSLSACPICCGRVTLISKMRHCGCEVSYQRHDILWWRQDAWQGSPKVYSPLLVSFLLLLFVLWQYC